MEELKHYVSEFGLTPLATSLGVSVQRLSNWLDRGVPLDYCAAVEQATHGKVLRKSLRPDDWQQIWPELANQKKKQAKAQSSIEQVAS